MSDFQCANVQYWLQQAFTAQQPALPDPDICAHIADCRLCRGTLAILMADALGLRIAPPRIRCTECQLDLATFIDHETALGQPSAIRHFPQVWWHLWTCAECAETYTGTHALLRMADDDRMLPLPGTQPHAHRPAYARLPHTFLYRALSDTPIVLGARRGAGGPPMVLVVDEALGAHMLTLSVQRQDDDMCCLIAELAPPPAGTLVARLGRQQFSAQLDAHGRARLPDVPFELLLGATGPDLELELTSAPANG